jgi:hypothetical protein
MAVSLNEAEHAVPTDAWIAGGLNRRAEGSGQAVSLLGVNTV